TRGEPFDPTSGDRIPTAAGIERARDYLAVRFPALAGAPLVEARVCQYENSPDGHLLIGRHPELDNVWIAGGGSGHGFKLGPAVGEHVAALVLGETDPLPIFRLDRSSESSGERIRTQFEPQDARSG
ncbi:MAG TPA: FAD-dependent oxidoreductase, partial [Thermoanaerobaculia bacterium]|nr:FAD-dependent oxidoreductase [Thermoanaerobaculia bacterium]